MAKYKSLNEQMRAEYGDINNNNNNNSNKEESYLISNICWIVFPILLISGIHGYIVHALFIILLIPVLLLSGWILKILWTFK